MQPLVAYATHSVQPKIVEKPLGRSVHYCSILAEKNNRSVLFPPLCFRRASVPEERRKNSQNHKPSDLRIRSHSARTLGASLTSALAQGPSVVSKSEIFFHALNLKPSPRSKLPGKKIVAKQNATTTGLLKLSVFLR